MHGDECDCAFCDPDRLSEAEKVESYRMDVLCAAGFPVAAAAALAASSVDLHFAVDLVASGCDHETAARILL
jgi:hypothetical protein